MQEFEYVVWDNNDNEIHRGPWTQEECITWLDECRNTFPEGAQIDKIWSIRRRAVGVWEKIDA